MAITPQAIKDQEFVVKFRGYDAIEVKAYLEMIAEEFFELFEEVRRQNEEIENLIEEKQDHIEKHAFLDKDISALMEKNNRLKDDLDKSNEHNADLTRKIDELEKNISELEQEKEEKERELAAAREEIAAEKKQAEIERKEKDKFSKQLAEVEGKWAEQKNVEIDFRETLLAAQKFSRDMKKSSEDEAHEILEKARKDAEKLRQDTFHELARYPKEIERLKMKRNQVREDLRTVLNLCLENLDIFKDDEEDEEDYTDLFQSMVVSDDGTVNQEELVKLNMELDLLESLHTEEASVVAEDKDTEAGDS